MGQTLNRRVSTALGRKRLWDTLCKACPTRGPDQSESGVFACVSKDKRIISVAIYLGLKKSFGFGEKTMNHRGLSLSLLFLLIVVLSGAEPGRMTTFHSVEQYLDSQGRSYSPDAAQAKIDRKSTRLNSSHT